jgi:hypothetical protein
MPAATADDGRDGQPGAMKREGEVGGGQHGGGSGGPQAPRANTASAFHPQRVEHAAQPRHAVLQLPDRFGHPGAVRGGGLPG